MKEYLASLALTAPSPTQARNLLREYLQARILGSLQRAGAMIPLAFHGETALRFLYALPRYSEDLDFALEHADSPYDLRAGLHAIHSQFSAEGYPVEIKVSDRRTVHNAFVRFPGLLYELGLSPHRSEVISVKIEVDTRPPGGAGLTTTVTRRHVTLQLQHHDRASLLAGKLHAILQRPFTKGRDLYDLLWYLSDPQWPAPNLILLNSALQQTGWKRGAVTERNWRKRVWERLDPLPWDQAIADVRPFLESSADVSLLNRDNLARVLVREVG